MSDLGHSTNWSETAASNNASPPNGWPEGQNPSDVNNCARENMAAIKRFWNQINAVKTTAGTSTAYTLTYDVAAAALYDGELVTFVLDETCGAAPTLNKNSLGAKNLRKFTAGAWANLAAADLVADQIVMARYNLAADKWDVIASAFSPTDFARVNATIAMSGAAINEAALVSVASAATCDIGAAASNYVAITGTTTITGLGTVQSGTRRHVVFTDALLLTYNATSLILPTSANITTVSGDTATFVSLGSGNWRCLDYQRRAGTPLALTTALLPAGTAIKFGSTFVNAYSTTAGTGITVDNSIPQNTEGDEIMTLAFTPTSATSKLIIEVGASLARANTDQVVMALFQDSTANALAAVVDYVNGSFPSFMTLRWVMTSGTTSATTFKVRAGSNTPAALYFNGNSSAGLMNGVMGSHITITEVAA